MLLVTVTFISASGQWYYDKYGVTDIDMLSADQLDQALGDTKSDLGKGGSFALAGGLFVGIGFYTFHEGLGEDPTILEQLLGSKFMGYTYIICGSGLFVAGTIWCLSDMGRLAQIKNARNRNYGVTGSLNISPAIMPVGSPQSLAPGITLRINF